MMETEEKPYRLLDGQELTENEYQKYCLLMAEQEIPVVRWMTDKEFENAIKQQQNGNTRD